MISSAALSRLLQLASPMLPVGAYAYSQGLEAAVESRIVHDADSARAWIDDSLRLGLCRFELPMLARMIAAWRDAPDDAAGWNDQFRAGRDSAEARAETLQMGWSLARLLSDLGGIDPDALDRLRGMEPVSYPLAYAFAATSWEIPPEAALQAYAWSWLENQVAAAMKAIPIGQAAAQRILLVLGGALPDLVAGVAGMRDDALSSVLPGLSLAACRHEMQYSRLFRS
jgi:urease accessory protein